MPRADGWEATRAIRKNGENKNTPIIITSANTNQMRAEDAEFGVLGVLPKPFLLKDLKTILQEFM